MSGPVERLRSAADLLDRRAAAAVPFRECGQDWCPAAHANSALSLAAPLAAWLRERAAYVDGMGGICNEECALAVADTILGGVA